MSELAVAAARVWGAGERRDRAALVDAARDYLAVASPLSRPPFFASPLITIHLGAILLTGQGPAFAERMHRDLWYAPPDGGPDVPFASVPEDALLARARRELFHLRLLSGRYEPVLRPGLFVPKYVRTDLRRGNNLLVALAARDAAKTGRAIGVYIRADTRAFSLFGYALYDLADRLGIRCKRPRKYAF